MRLRPKPLDMAWIDSHLPGEPLPGEEPDRAYTPAQGIFIGLGIGTLLWGVIIFIWWLI